MSEPRGSRRGFRRGGATRGNLFRGAALAALWAGVAAAGPLRAAGIALPRGELLRQDDGWFAGETGRGLADNLVAQQAKNGGWTNWTNEGGMLRAATPAELAKLNHGSIDDKATTTQLRLLARVVAAARDASDAERARTGRFRAAFDRGLDFLFNAQYPNGGWPQHVPGPGYRSAITFNDDAMANVILLLRDIAAGRASFAWVDAGRRDRAAQAASRGITCILRCQVVVDGRKTAWGAQHDPQTLAPVAARKFEPASLCGHETVGLVRLLMTAEPVTPEIVSAVQAAVAWLEQVKITGHRFERVAAAGGKDGRLVPDASAPPLWARFYEIGTNRPMFAGRDGVVKYELAQIEQERRGGYGWYSDRANDLLAKEYPRWAAQGVK